MGSQEGFKASRVEETELTQAQYHQNQEPQETSNNPEYATDKSQDSLNNDLTHVLPDGRVVRAESPEDAIARCPILREMDPEHAKTLLGLIMSSERDQKEKPKEAKPEDRSKEVDKQQKLEKVTVEGAKPTAKTAETATNKYVVEQTNKDLEPKHVEEELIQGQDEVAEAELEQPREQTVADKPNTQNVINEEHSRQEILIQEQAIKQQQEDQNRLAMATKLATKATREPEIIQAKPSRAEAKKQPEQKTKPLPVYQEYIPPIIRKEQMKTVSEQTNNSMDDKPEAIPKIIVQGSVRAPKPAIAKESVTEHKYDEPISYPIIPETEILLHEYDDDQPDLMAEQTEREVFDEVETSNYEYVEVDNNDAEEFREMAIDILQSENPDLVVDIDTSIDATEETVQELVVDAQAYNLEQTLDQIVQEFANPVEKPLENNTENTLTNEINAPEEQPELEKIKVTLQDISSQIKEFVIEGREITQIPAELTIVVTEKLSDLLTNLGYDMPAKNLQRIVDDKGLEYLLEIIDQTYSKISPDNQPEIDGSSYQLTNLYQDLELIKYLFKLAFTSTRIDAKQM